jgi:hypothetical protein
MNTKNKQEIISHDGGEYAKLLEKYKTLKKIYKMLEKRMKEFNQARRPYLQALAGARSDITIGLEDTPYVEECVVCREVKPIIGICTTCWNCLRKALEMKTAKSKGSEDWAVWGYEVGLDIKPLSKMLSQDKEGKELLLKAVYNSENRKDRNISEFLKGKTAMKRKPWIMIGGNDKR